MTKETNRKKSATLVLGPITYAAVQEYCEHMQAAFPGQLWTPTDVVGVAFRKFMREQFELGTIKAPKRLWISNHE